MKFFGWLKENRIRICQFCKRRIPANEPYAVVGDGDLRVTCNKCFIEKEIEIA